ncbi:MAG TPA: hypothetical protein VEF05_09675 [Terriglobales bacterium]|nr:hypothetical protein [Terriglobales bacterium]
MLPDPPTEPPSILDADALLSDIPFQDLGRAQQNCSRIRRGISAELASRFPAMLADAPDPDSALAFFDRLVSDGSPETLQLFEQHHHLAHYALIVFAHSQFLGETLLRNPDLLSSILQEKTLDRSFSRDDFQERLGWFRSHYAAEISTLLARFKRREYVRILLRDVLKIAPLAETTAEISALADVLLEGALEEAQNELQRRYGPAQHPDQSGRLQEVPFAVLSLGKLGGNELNYSSDIDLMFVFGDGVEPSGTRISNREYFIRLAQEVTSVLSCATPEGPVFRIDLRLRPQGREGELAISLPHAARYYATTAHDWELQALIKARHSAGDPALARQFIQAVRPYVYTEEANFPAIKTALVARERMQKHRLRPGEQDAGIDVKIDNGGIRDIEFLVQCLQRVHGGAEPWLRSSGTLFSLQKLYDNRHLSGREFHELTSAYEFLRTLEHRLQLRRGQQTHRMPPSGADLQILQRTMGQFDPAQESRDEFVAIVRRRMSVVSEIYRRVIYQQQNRGDRAAAHAGFHLRPAPEVRIADHSDRQILERLAVDSPVLHTVATREDLSSAARKNLFRFFTGALTSSERYAAMLRHADDVARALTLFEVSEYLTQILARYPEEVATLADLGAVPSRMGSGYLFESPLIQPRTADPAFAYVASSAAPYSEKLARLRSQFRHRACATGAKDIAELRDVYRSCAETTSAAEDAIAAAFEIADAPAGLAIMALGRLGGGELDLLSDADLLFIVADGHDAQQLARAVSQIVQVLTAYTRDGMIFPVDTRLRPRGAEGELLTSAAELIRYFEQEAHAWEALTYTKLRFIAGCRRLGQTSTSAAESLFQRFAGCPDFLPAIREMRQKLEALDSENNFKTSPGAVYDIDFLCGFLLVRHGIRNKNGTLRDRIWRCAEAALLSKEDAAVLDHAGELLRTVDHVVRLIVGRPFKWLPATEHARHATEKLASEILGRKFHDGLEAELDRTCRAVRTIYIRVLAGLPG